MTASAHSRRSFLLSSSSVLGGAWLASSWPEIASAAHHAAASGAPVSKHKLEALSAPEATQLEAIAAQIIPSGVTPGAQEAHAVFFIDRALATFFAGMAPQFHSALAEFSKSYETRHAGSGGFAAASVADQAAYLKTVESTPFFQTVRFLTVLGFLTSPQYGGNADGIGWKAIGFVDEHMFEPPFGYYDKDYPGFVPYGMEKKP